MAIYFPQAILYIYIYCHDSELQYKAKHITYSSFFNPKYETINVRGFHHGYKIVNQSHFYGPHVLVYNINSIFETAYISLELINFPWQSLPSMRYDKYGFVLWEIVEIAEQGKSMLKTVDSQLHDVRHLSSFVTAKRVYFVLYSYTGLQVFGNSSITISLSECPGIMYSQSLKQQVEHYKVRNFRDNVIVNFPIVYIVASDVSCCHIYTPELFVELDGQILHFYLCSTLQHATDGDCEDYGDYMTKLQLMSIHIDDCSPACGKEDSKDVAEGQCLKEWVMGAPTFMEDLGINTGGIDHFVSRYLHQADTSVSTIICNGATQLYVRRDIIVATHWLVTPEKCEYKTIDEHSVISNCRYKMLEINNNTKRLDAAGKVFKIDILRNDENSNAITMSFLKVGQWNMCNLFTTVRIPMEWDSPELEFKLVRQKTDVAIHYFTPGTHFRHEEVKITTNKHDGMINGTCQLYMTYNFQYDVPKWTRYYQLKHTGNQYISWQEARDLCKNESGTHLIMPKTFSELHQLQQFVLSSMDNSTIGQTPLTKLLFPLGLTMKNNTVSIHAKQIHK